MRIARALAGCALLATLALLSSDGVLSQEKKDKAKVKGQLPQGWSKLDLTAAQKEEIYKINADSKEKVDKLKADIRYGPRLSLLWPLCLALRASGLPDVPAAE